MRSDRFDPRLHDDRRKLSSFIVLEDQLANKANRFYHRGSLAPVLGKGRGKEGMTGWLAACCCSRVCMMHRNGGAILLRCVSCSVLRVKLFAFVCRKRWTIYRRSSKHGAWGVRICVGYEGHGCGHDHHCGCTRQGHFFATLLSSWIGRMLRVLMSKRKFTSCVNSAV